MTETDTDKNCVYMVKLHFVCINKKKKKKKKKEREHLSSLMPEQKSPNWRPLQKF